MPPRPVDLSTIPPDPTIIQTAGIRTLICGTPGCGATSQHRVRPQSHRIECPSCHRVRVVGNLIFNIAPGPIGREPVDIACARYAGTQDAGTLPAVEAGQAAETSVHGGIWRSRDPINIEMVELSELWRERTTGRLWMAASVAYQSRYIAQSVDNAEDRRIVAYREWTAAFERV